MATRIEGLDRFKRRLAAIPARMRAEVKAALDANADELVEAQRGLVPVDDGVLRDSIRKEDGRHELAVEVKAGGGKAFYAHFVEFGTQATPARPFFFGPYRARRRRFKNRVARAMRKAIRGS